MACLLRLRYSCRFYELSGARSPAACARSCNRSFSQFPSADTDRTGKSFQPGFFGEWFDCIPAQKLSHDLGTRGRGTILFHLQNGCVYPFQLFELPIDCLFHASAFR